MGREFLPKFNEGTATINAIAQPGISLNESNNIGNKIEKALIDIPEVKSVARRTGRAEQDEHAEGVHYSEIDVDFNQSGRNREIVLAEMRKKLESIPNVFINIGQPISHRLDHLLSGVRAQIAIKIFGSNLTTLRSKAAEIYKTLQNIHTLVDLQLEQQIMIPQIKIQLLRQEIANYGIAVGDLTDNLEMALNGEVVAQVIENQNIFNIFMRFDEQSRSDIDKIKNITFKTMPDGTKVNLAKLADVFESTGPNIINRENIQRRIVISANSQSRDLYKLIQEIKTNISDKIKLPSGYFIQYGGQFENQQAAYNLILILSMLSLAGIFLVLYGHFRSSFIAIQIMLNIPMALIGSLIAIYFSSRTFSIATLVAFITLCGIASRNGIMMISHYLHLMKFEAEKFDREMIIRGSVERLIPVLMTALTAILGLLPLIFAGNDPGKEILHPVAVVIVGGLLSSTLLDIFVTPAVFFKFGKKSAEKALNKELIYI